MVFRPKILIVENDPKMLRLLRDSLSKLGAEPCTMDSAPKAAEMLETIKYDGVFLEWTLPDLDGLGLTKRIRKSKLNKGCPIVILTSADGPKILKESFQAGANFFLQKPVTIGQIRHLLNASRGMMLAEHRRFQRAPVNFTLLCHWSNKSLKGQAVDLSASGMLFTLPETPNLGDEMRVEFKLPDEDKPIHLTGMITRLMAGDQVGIHFVKPEWEIQKRIMDFTDRALSRVATT